MTTKNLFLTTIAVIICFCIVWYIETQPRDTYPTKIGIIAPFEWQLKVFGQSLMNIYTIQVEKHNTANPDNQVTLIPANADCSTKGWIRAATELISKHHVQLAMWGSCSAEALWAMRVAQKNDMFLMAPTASSADLIYLNDTMFRIMDNGLAAKKLVEYLHKHNIRNIAVVVENTPAAIPFGYNVTQNFTGNITVNLIISQQEGQIENTLAILDQVDIEALIVFTQGPFLTVELFNKMMQQWTYENYRKKIYSAFNLSTKKFNQLFTGNKNWIKEVGLPSAHYFGADAMDFIQEYKQYSALKLSEWLALNAKIGIDLLLKAIEKGHKTPATIKTFLKQFNQQNPIQTSIGPIHFDFNGNAQNIIYSINQLSGDHIILLE